MKTKFVTKAPKSVSGKLTRAKGEKFSAVEGQYMTPRVSGAFREADAKGIHGDARRTLIREKFNKKSA